MSVNNGDKITLKTRVSNPHLNCGPGTILTVGDGVSIDMANDLVDGHYAEVTEKKVSDDKSTKETADEKSTKETADDKSKTTKK